MIEKKFQKEVFLMKTRSSKKILAVLLAAAMTMSSSFMVCAADGSGGSGTDAGPSQSTTTSSSSNSSSSSSSSDTSSAPVVHTEDVRTADAVISIAGTSVRTSIAGAYAAKSVQGIAVTTSLNDVVARLGLGSGQKPYVMLFDTDPVKSNKAMDCVNAAASALGGTVVTTLNIQLGAKQGGRLITLSDGSVNMVAGLPKSADTTKTYSIVCVQPGGIISIFDDLDTNPQTVTFEVAAGLGTYALVAK